MQLQHFTDTQALTEFAATHAVRMLNEAISTHGQATWVLAGGSTPVAAYRLLAEQYLDAVDWSRVTFLIGDERIAALDSPDSNWHAAEQALLRHIPQANLLRPISDQTAESGAGEYAAQLAQLPQVSGLPRFDLVWLGMGEDGHTLSLFPNHPGSHGSNELVIPVHDSPKPPADRISLTLHALGGAQSTVILVVGSGKAAAVKNAQSPSGELPIALAARRTNALWLVDHDASAMLY